MSEQSTRYEKRDKRKEKKQGVSPSSSEETRPRSPAEKLRGREDASRRREGASSEATGAGLSTGLPRTPVTPVLVALPVTLPGVPELFRAQGAVRRAPEYGGGSTPRSPADLFQIPIVPLPRVQPVIQPVVAPVVVPVPVAPVRMAPTFRIKYTRFKGDGTQDVDDWMEQFQPTLAGNDETDDATARRLFRGLIDGEAMCWYNSQSAMLHGDWPGLRAAFVKEFREIGADARVMARLNSVMMKPGDFLRSYTKKVQKLIGKLSAPPPDNLQLEWFISGLPELLDFQVRKVDPSDLEEAIKVAKLYDKSALLSEKWANKKVEKKKVTFADEESDDSDDFIALVEKGDFEDYSTYGTLA